MRVLFDAEKLTKSHLYVGESFSCMIHCLASGENTKYFDVFIIFGVVSASFLVDVSAQKWNVTGGYEAASP
jgi:hypothetical protein